MAIEVRMFNANSLPINVMINNGSSFEIPAAEGPKWDAPAAPPGQVSFKLGGPAPGELGVGTNVVSLTPKGVAAPFLAHIPLPSEVNWTSIQVYIFFQTAVACSWVVLNNGQVVANAFAVASAR